MEYQWDILALPIGLIYILPGLNQNMISEIKEFYYLFRCMDGLAFNDIKMLLKCSYHSKELDQNDIYTLYPLNFLHIKPTYDTYFVVYLTI